MNNLTKFLGWKSGMLFLTLLLATLFIGFNSFKKEERFLAKAVAKNAKSAVTCPTPTGLMLINNTPTFMINGSARYNLVCAQVDQDGYATSYEWYDETLTLIATTSVPSMCAEWTCAYGSGVGGIYVRTLGPCGYSDFAGPLYFGYDCP